MFDSLVSERNYFLTNKKMRNYFGTNGKIRKKFCPNGRIRNFHFSFLRIGYSIEHVFILMNIPILPIVINTKI